jgi:hypothetical protein
MFSIPAQGVVVDGHHIGRAALRNTAAEYLIAAHQWPPDDADEATESASVARAWWDGEQFVQADHAAALPVSVVNIANAP